MKKWYKKPITKAILVFVAIVTAILLGISVILLASLNGVVYDAKLRAEKKYENANSFEQTMYQTATYVAERIHIQDEFETDGKYNPDKIVDIIEYAKSRTISGENTSGVAYKLGELAAWGQAKETSSEDADDYRIIVCKKKDGKYYYYYYNEFQNLINDAKLKVILNGAQLRPEENAEENSQLQTFYDNLSYNYGVGMSNYYDTIRIEDEKGNTLYTDCWLYDGNWDSSIGKEEAAPIGAKNLLTLINENEKLNGKLNKIYNDLSSSLENIAYDAEQYGEYKDSTDFSEGNTNFKYLLVDQQAKKVYTNNSAWTQYSNVDKNIEELKKQEHSKYVVVKPKLADFESNLKDTDARKWKEVFHILEGDNKESDNYIFVAAVDTDFPVQDVFYTYNQNYRQYAPYINMASAFIIVGTALCLIIIVWLTAVAGRNSEDEELHLNSFDYWKSELGAALVIVPWIFLTMFVGECWEGTYYDAVGWGNTSQQYYYTFSLSGMNYVLVTIYMGLSMVLFLVGYLSLVRRIKGRILWKNSILYFILKWCIKVLRAIVRFFRDFWRNRSITWRAVLVFIGFVCIHWLGMSSGVGMFIFLMFVAEIVGLYYIVRNTIAKDKVRKGIERIASGDLEYQIPTEKLKGEYKHTAEMINDIGNGLNRAVDEKIKSERLKTDLITNVSHDIKTPLTSIINYVDLLKREDIDDPKIQGYLKVLEEKSQRLKTLTEDVVEASKVSSGNINLQMMDVNFVEILNQTIGEIEEKMSANDLEVIASVPESPVIVHVDGRRMWRVLENIFNNAAKYAMPGTRVYADLQIEEEVAEFTLKNISAQKLNIKAEELTERFIRGDISRSTEGSGLGLSIASTLTEMQGGTFEVYVDGDLFKVTITLPLKESR